jgi:hypothetical protein
MAGVAPRGFAGPACRPQEEDNVIAGRSRQQHGDAFALPARGTYPDSRLDLKPFLT